MSAVKPFAHPIIASFMMMALVGLTACSSTPENSSSAYNSEAAELNTQLGLEYMKEGMPDIARTKFEKALTQNPRSPNVHTGLGMFNNYLGDATTAEKHFLRAYELAARSSDGKGAESNNLGRFYCAQQRYDESNKFFQLAFTDKYYTRKEVAYTNAAICARSQQQDDTAASLLRTALQINKDHPLALQQMAQLSFDQQIYPQARTYLDRYFEAGGSKTAETLWLGYQIERATSRSAEVLRQHANELKTYFPDSEQTAMLYRLETKGGNE